MLLIRPRGAISRAWWRLPAMSETSELVANRRRSSAHLCGAVRNRQHFIGLWVITYCHENAPCHENDGALFCCPPATDNGGDQGD
jgi:hypothetical protein